jgi:hypothetical protein
VLGVLTPNIGEYNFAGQYPAPLGAVGDPRRHAYSPPPALHERQRPAQLRRALPALGRVPVEPRRDRGVALDPDPCSVNTASR